MGELVAAGELTHYLRKPVDAASEEVAIRVAEAWLRGKATALTSWPAPVPEDLWAWALELAAIAYENPLGLATRTAGDYTQEWAIARKQEILDEVERRYGAAAAPVYDFPPAPCWPGG